MKYLITVYAHHPTKDVSKPNFTAKWQFIVELDEDKEEFIRTSCHNTCDILCSQELIFVKKRCLISKKVHKETPDYVIYNTQEWGCGKAITFYCYEGVKLYVSFPKPISDEEHQPISSPEEGE